MTTAGIRTVGLGGLTAAAFFVIGALYASAPAEADTVLMVGGADVQAFPGAENGVYMPAILGGYLCKSGSGNQCFVVPFSGAAGVLTPQNPQPLDGSVASAADRLVEQIKQTPGAKMAVGYSAGASVVEEAARRLNDDPNGPPPEELSLMTVGNINDGLAKMVPPGTYLQSLGYTVRPAAQTKYPKTVITDRYDALANSMPNPVTYPLAALNSVSGAVYSHLGYFSPDIDLADPSYLVSQNGNVRHLMLPSQSEPPLATALRDMGQPQLADTVIGQLQSQAPTSPGGAATQAYPLSPGTVDQLIGVAAPTFVSLLNNDKDKVVEMLWPVLVDHPEMFNGVPLFSPQTAAAPTIVNSPAAPANGTTSVQTATGITPGS